MDLERTQTTPNELRKAGLSAKPGDDKKELAWAFLGLILWSGVVLVGVFGAGYVLGHSILHIW
ncbi:MAG: hypothetical protein JO119_21155 [Acidobacteria bacterium]|nr:hypothetical protein [Acidobacteriota bacterium]